MEEVGAVGRAHTYAPATRDALTVLGGQIAAARRERRMTAAELAERAGVSLPTLRNVERGRPTVAIGVVFEVATLLGVPLFGTDEGGLRDAASRSRERLALLPSRVRVSTKDVDDDF